MATLLLRPLFRPHTLGLTFGLSISAYCALHQRPLHLDAVSSLNATPISTSPSYSYREDAKTPITKGGRLNPRAVRQMSAGSIIGLGGGLLVSAFSRPLALIIGLLVLGVQYASSRGINLIPTSMLQKYVKEINIRSALHDNVAFKVAFGSTLILAAFVDF